MRKGLGMILAVLLLLCSFALAEEQPTVTFDKKGGSVNCGFTHKVQLNVSAAQADAFDVNVTDDNGKTYTVTFPDFIPIPSPPVIFAPSKTFILAIPLTEIPCGESDPEPDAGAVNVP